MIDVLWEGESKKKHRHRLVERGDYVEHQVYIPESIPPWSSIGRCEWIKTDLARKLAEITRHRDELLVLVGRTVKIEPSNKRVRARGSRGVAKR